MRFRRILGAITCTLLSFSSGIFTAAPRADGADRVGATPSTECSTQFFRGDSRLGPEKLATSGPIVPIVAGYRRFAGLTANEFLDRFFDPAANGGRGGYRFPPANGFLLGHNGQPQEMALRLAAFQQLDRFGSEFGGFLAPLNTPFASRSLPPQSLDDFDPAFTCNYHRYKVIKPFSVEAGPIAPAFGQRGLGQQYQLDATLVPGAPTPLNVLWLVDHGFLARAD